MNGIVVVKLGGTTLAEQRGLLAQVAALARTRPIVLVHGGGKRVTDWLERLGVPTRFEEGLRVTDEAALEVTAAVLRGSVNVELVAALRELGCDAVGLSGVDGGTLEGDRVPGKGLVVNPTDVRPALLRELLAAGRVPVVAPLALDREGTICNANADDAAAALARELPAERLLLLTDVDGIRDASGARIDRIDGDEAERLIESGVIHGGMIPKVRAALRALADGRGATSVIVDGSHADALRRALEGAGSGTRIGPG